MSSGSIIFDDPSSINDFMTNSSLIMTEQQEVQLIFSDEGLPKESGFVSKGGITDKFKGFATGIDQITEWFNKYEVDSIELWIQGAVETNGIVKLLVSAKGEGGMKITLTPKTTG